MKNKFLAIALTAVALGMVGCDDYLDRQPKDQFTDKNYWSSEATLETYAWMLYENFSGYGEGWTRGQFHSEGMCDDYSSDGFSQPTRNLPSSSSAWNGRYTEIRRANTLLNRVDRVTSIDEVTANHWRGVARFFRAMKHFELVSTYGDCVWVETEIDIDDANALGVPRIDRVEVMKKVCEDLEFAGKNCRYSTDNTVNNMCAWALLSRAALFEAAWQKYHANNAADAQYFYQIAKTAAENVIASGKYSINEDYKGQYIAKDLMGNKEMILFKMYSYGDVKYAHGMQGWSCSSSKAWGLTKSAVESFANADGLPIHMSGYSDATVEQVFRNRDARLTQVVCDTIVALPTYPFEEGINSSTGYWTSKFVDWNDYGKTTWNAPYNDTDAPVYTYPEVLLNYAEACAELEDLGAYTLTQTDLDKSVNLLREKHGKIPPLTVAGKGELSVKGTQITKDPKNTWGISNTLWELRRERRSELMADGFRYNDIRRWKQGALLDFKKNPDGYLGVKIDALRAFWEATKDRPLYQTNDEGTLRPRTWEEVTRDIFVENGYLAAYNTASNSRVWDETKNYLEPIPSGQITLNPNLAPNNPGW